jgi:hypothetical protein
MKIKTIVMCVLAFSLVFALFISMMGDMQQGYPEVAINDSSWSKYGENGSLNYVQSIGSEGSALKVLMQSLSDESGNAWYDKIAIGIVAIPKAILQAIGFVFSSMLNAGAIMTDVMANIIGVPPFVVYILDTILLIAILFAVISFFQRHPA